MTFVYNLAPAAYTEGDAFQAEKAGIFAREWLPICVAGQLPNPGDYSSNSIGGWPVFAVRGADGGVRVFRNVCRHQKMQVVEKPGGNCTELRCRYHGWTYDLAGRFRTAPDTVAPADPSSPENHLPELATRGVHGLVMFTLGSGDAPPVTTEIDAAFARALGDGAGEHRGAITTEIGCNWKVYFECRLDSPQGREGGLAWQWPLVIVRPLGPGLVVEQVVPRTFLRTRVVSHLVFGDPPGAARDEAAAEAECIKAACEALQAERVAGTMPQPSGRIEELHARLAAARAADPLP